MQEPTVKYWYSQENDTQLYGPVRVPWDLDEDIEIIAEFAAHHFHNIELLTSHWPKEFFIYSSDQKDFLGKVTVDMKWIPTFANAFAARCSNNDKK